MKRIVILLLMGLSSTLQYMAQSSYNACSSPFELCPQQTAKLNNFDANISLCPGCEDDFNFCFQPYNSIWVKFTTNTTGGDIQLDFSSVIFNMEAGRDQELNTVLLSTGVPCLSAGYSVEGTCVANATGNFSIAASSLNPVTEYYLVISGAMDGAGITLPAEASFDLVLTGNGVERPTPSISLDSGANPLCLNELATLQATTNNCPDYNLFSWYINGALVAQTSDSSYQTTELQNGDFVSVSCDCYTQCPLTVSQGTVPYSVTSFTVDAGDDVEIVSGETVQLNGSTTAASFIWTPPVNISNPAVLEPYVSPTQTTVYQLEATQGGCTSYDQVVVTVQSDLVIHNTFSPNDDLINDTWEIDGIEAYPNSLVRIYNRWGAEVFEQSAYSSINAWNGRGKQGAKLQEGVYYYVIELRDVEGQILKGNINLIR